ncbi:hypothetical protein [Streptomyces iconiensis]|uniref:Secreted protein n=1 Tax=Streptomyces iconiensis TaxID=1384038 RepID=A0ABT7A4Q0_9ACTN|nr:hypothetical protein [Streptomyces iconiensis]MDJ1135598.1 hypothetical protein [Streptomyces iconiensis]
MAALAWLLIPVVAAVAAGLWGSWAGRRRTTTPDAAGVAGYERFRAAMERSSAEAKEVSQEADPHEDPVPAGAASPGAGAVAQSASEGPGRAGA